MSDVGVVDPIRVPMPVLRAATWFRGRPRVAQAFIALAVADALVRTPAILGPGVNLGPSPLDDVVHLFAGYVPRAATIVLPAVVVLRRPTAASDTPWVLRGSLVVALLTAIAAPVVTILDAAAPGLASGSWPYTVTAVAFGLAYVVMGFGLTVLNSPAPRPVVAGLANLAALAIVVSQGISYLAYLVRDLPFRLDAGFLSVSTAIPGTLQLLAVAYLARAIVRGLDDPGRPELATRVATVAALLWAIAELAGQLVSLVDTIGQRAVLPTDVGSGIGLVESVVPVVLAVAFGLGLADPLRPLAKDWAAALAEAGSA